MGSIARCLIGKWAVVLMVVAASVLQGCSGSDFKVNAELKGLGNQNVRVVYHNAQGGITDMWLMAQSDKLEIAGDCTSPSLLMVYNSMNVAIMRLVVNGGDRLEVKGQIADQYGLTVKGSQVMEQWNDFVVKHKSEYNMPSAVKLNAAIEAFVKDNPKSMVSTLLTLVDYAPDDEGAKVAALLKTIDESAKPQGLMDSYNQVAMLIKRGETTITSLNLLEMKSDDFEVARFTGSKPSVLCFWDKSMTPEKRLAAMEELKMLDSTSVNIVDINIDADSAQWRSAVAATGSHWKHYWVPGSMMNSQLMRLHISSTPTIIVADSLGHQQYRGSDPVKARQTVESL
ncbi:MAG: hypothetical protein IJG81_09215 [Muribaculaceae bacterium]|nr:hypothetical protein [Muribaculaceae bacterium]